MTLREKHNLENLIKATGEKEFVQALGELLRDHKVVPVTRRIVDTSPTLRQVDPGQVAQALGAEIYDKDEWQ